MSRKKQKKAVASSVKVLGSRRNKTMKKERKEAIGVVLLGGLTGALMLYWMLGPLIQF